MRTAQISIEYLIIIGVIVLLVVVPSAIFLSSFTQNTLHRTVTEEKAAEFGEGLTAAAEQVYYLGLYSKRNVVLPVPDTIQKLSVLDITTSEKTYYYIVVAFLDDGESTVRYYQSRAPLLIQDPKPSYSGGAAKECAVETCMTQEFPSTVAKPGDKRFILESVLDEGRVVVQITPVIA